MELSEQQTIYRSNALPGIVQTLAEQLGVSTESLERLGVGWKIDSHAWSFPERNAEGDIIGISLRGWDGKKFCVKGSKRGLTFDQHDARIVLSHVQTKGTYNAGSQNWRRVSADTPCPICGKPDWCLVSAEQPDDPQAVICSRIEKNCEASLAGSGYLHIRKDSGNLRSTGTVEDADLPILVVEGVSDTAAAFDLGFPCVGRPSADGGRTFLRSILVARSIVVLGENDAGAGRHGMEKTFEALKSVAKSVVKIMPPGGIKDLRAWVRSGLTQRGLLDVIDVGETETVDGTLVSDDPIGIARRWIKDKCMWEQTRGLHYYQEEWYHYVNGMYRSLTSTAIASQLYLYLEGRNYVKETSKGPTVELYKANDNKIHSLSSAAKAVCTIYDDPPCWLSPGEHPTPQNVIVFRNGILDVETGHLMAATPDLFVTTAAPYPYDPLARCPRWMQFLREVFEDDVDSIQLLREWFGYCLVRDRTHEKIMLLIGRTGSGKGTTMTVLEAMLGKDQCASSSFSTMSSDFGLQHLIDKPVILIPDARLSRRNDTARALETILTISGFDAIEIRRKFLDTLRCVLPGRITIGTNEFPNLPDHTQALERRLLLLNFKKSFVDKMDVHLKERLRHEAPGVANWAIKGLRSLRERGEFTSPESTGKIRREFMTYLSPIAAFVEECCVVDPELEVLTTQFQDAWRAWATGPPVSWSLQKIGMDLQNHIPTCEKIRRRSGNSQREYVYTGLALTDSAKIQFLGRPGR